MLKTLSLSIEGIKPGFSKFKSSFLAEKIKITKNESHSNFSTFFSFFRPRRKMQSSHYGKINTEKIDFNKFSF
jgi:hypothetical protein